MSSEPRSTANTTLTAATTSAAGAPSRSCRPSARRGSPRRPARSMRASAIKTSRKPSTSVSGNRSAASAGGMTAFSAPMIAATTSAPQKFSMSTPGRIPAATINAMPVANHETRSGKTSPAGTLGLPGAGSTVLGPGSLDIALPFPHVCALTRRGRRLTHRRPQDAAEAEVRGRRVDRLALARRRPVAKAVARCAEVRAALDHAARDRLARLERSERHAGVPRHAACAFDFVGMARR